MMLTYSLGDDIYTEILIPMKREKVYLITMTIGVILNIGLSFLLALTAFKDNPVIGVAIATGGTDFIILFYLLYETREYSLKAIFRLNNLKIVLVGAAIALLSFFMAPIIENALPMQETWQRYLLGMIIVVLIDAVIYIAGLLLLKENLVSSFLPKRRRERESLNA